MLSRNPITVFIIIFTIIMFGFGAILAKDRIELLANSDTYAATIIDCEWKKRRAYQSKSRSGKTINSYAPVAISEEGYSAIGFLKVTSKSLCENMIGHEVTILVDPNNPGKAQIYSFFQFWFFPFILLGAIAFGLACLLKRLKLAIGIFCGWFLFGGVAAAIEFKVFQDPPQPPSFQPVNGAKAIQACIDQAMQEENVQHPGRLKRLNCKTRSVTDLSTLKQLTSLEELDLSSNQIESLTPLAMLSGLRSLTLDGNKTLRSLDGLQHLNRLETLKVHCAALEDIEAVKDLKGLSHLDLSCNKFSSLSPLADLDALEKVIIDDNPNVTNILPLANKAHLEVITLYHTPVSDITPLFGNGKLRRANIGSAGNVPCHQITELRSRLVTSAQIIGPKACNLE